MNRWDEVIALAREIDHARRIGVTVDPDKARRLAKLVLALENQPPRAHDASVDREPVSSS